MLTNRGTGVPAREPLRQRFHAGIPFQSVFTGRDARATAQPAKRLFVRPVATAAPCQSPAAANVGGMRYVVKARVKPGRERALLAAIEDGSLGHGSIAGDEYLHNMQQ